MKLKHYGWVLVIVGACIIAIQQALAFYTFGVFLRPITMEFNWDRGALSVASSMCVLSAGLFAIFAGRLSDKYGPRILVTLSGLFTGTVLLLMSKISALWQVYLLWGPLMGVGSCCCFIPILSTIPRWFVKYRGIAIGITLTGFGVGGTILPLLAQWLISNYSWQQAYIILGLMAFIIITPLAQFMKHSPQRIGLKPYGENEPIGEKQPASTTREFSFTQVIKTRSFWLVSSILFCLLFFGQIILVHIKSHAIDIGISAMVATGILSSISGTSIISRLSISYTADKIGSRLTLSGCIILAALAPIWLLFAKEVWMLYMFAVIFGFSYGGIIPLQTILLTELFGLKSLGMILGATILLSTAGGALGVPLAGSIFDITGSYNLAFLICVIIGAVAIILNLILWGSLNDTK